MACANVCPVSVAAAAFSGEWNTATAGFWEPGCGLRSAAFRVRRIGARILLTENDMAIGKKEKEAGAIFAKYLLIFPKDC
jgi:hypothetical protein